MMLRTALLFGAAWASAGAECLPVSGERILARDLARAVPAFAGLAPDLVLGFAPAFAARRAYGFPELARLARRYGLTVEPGAEACFVRPVETLTGERVTSVLRAAMPHATIDVLEFSRQPIPAGELRFPLSGLRMEGTDGPVLWHGMVSAPGQDDFPVWAKVRIRVSARRVRAAETLSPGHPIAPSQLREEAYEGQPGLPDLTQVAGRVARRLIPAGTVIRKQWLDVPADVVRGERVQMEIRSGRALVRFDAQAQSSGSRGEFVAVRNPVNGKSLRGMVTGRGRVVLATGPEDIPAVGANP